MRNRGRAGATWLAGLLAALGAIAAVAPAAAHADVVWLCQPGLKTVDPCERPLDTTLVSPAGTQTLFAPARTPENRRPLDCFYVYPTVSNQTSTNATKAPDPEIQAVTQFQASRFSSVCRMYVPLYRQVTVADVAGNGIPGGPIEEAYGDVLEAWQSYLARDNDGRGFILLGHSQGSILLRELIRTQIDPNPAVRARFAGAVLLGGNVTTKAGQTTGGDFTNIPLCTRYGQFGCVVAYSTSSTDPEPANFFGNTNTDLLSGAFGEPHGAGYEVACTDPGPLSGETGPFSVWVPSAPFPPGYIADGIAATTQGATMPSVKTTWIDDFQYQGSCQTINGAHVLRYNPVNGSPMLHEFPPAWGTHLVDFQLGLDRLVRIAGNFSQGWLSSHFTAAQVTLARGHRGPVLRVTVPGAGRVTISARGLRRRSARASAPVTLSLPLVAATRRRSRRRIRVTITYRPGVGAPVVLRRQVPGLAARR